MWDIHKAVQGCTVKQCEIFNKVVQGYLTRLCRDIQWGCAEVRSGWQLYVMLSLNLDSLFPLCSRPNNHYSNNSYSSTHLSLSAGSLKASVHSVVTSTTVTTTSVHTPLTLSWNFDSLFPLCCNNHYSDNNISTHTAHSQPELWQPLPTLL